MVPSSRIRASALMRADSSLLSPRSLAISRMFCFISADFLLLAMLNLVTAILSAIVWIVESISSADIMSSGSVSQSVVV